MYTLDFLTQDVVDMFEKYITDDIFLGLEWRKVEESGEWSAFYKGVVILAVQTPSSKPLYHIKPYLSNMFYMLHNTANSPVCQLHLLQICDKMGYKNV